MLTPFISTKEGTLGYIVEDGVAGGVAQVEAVVERVEREGIAVGVGRHVATEEEVVVGQSHLSEDGGGNVGLTTEGVNTTRGVGGTAGNQEGDEGEVGRGYLLVVEAVVGGDDHKQVGPMLARPSAAGGTCRWPRRYRQRS